MSIPRTTAFTQKLHELGSPKATVTIDQYKRPQWVWCGTVATLTVCQWTHDFVFTIEAFGSTSHHYEQDPVKAAVFAHALLVGVGR